MCDLYESFDRRTKSTDTSRCAKKSSSQQNITVYDVYTDVVSGTKDSRPELNRMMFDMRKGLFNYIMVYKLDRLGRSLKHLITICEELNKKKIALWR